MSLNEGRDWARTALSDMAHGIDPRSKEAARREAEARRRANSFASVAEEFLARHIRKLRSAAPAEGMIRRELVARWGEKPIAEISRRDIVACLRSIADSGRPGTADMVYRHISKLFSWVVAQELYGLETSPCIAIRSTEIIGARQPRQRVLNDSEIRALWTATEGLRYPLGPYVRLLLILGQRRSETAEMRWTEVDLDAALWVIPAARMKGNAAHEVPLPGMAVEILKSLPRWTGDFVFSTMDGERPIANFSELKANLDAAFLEPIEAWRFHDLRRSMRTGLGALPIPPNVAEMVIAHVQPQMHRIYDRGSYRAEKQRALALWSARLAEIVAPEREGKVIQISAGRP